MKKFKAMLEAEQSDLTKALDELFEDPNNFKATHPAATATLTKNPNCLHPISNYPELVTVLTGALGLVINAPFDPPDVPKVIEHIDNWPNELPFANAKKQVQKALALVLDPAANPKNYGVKWKWTMFEEEGDDQITIKIKFDQNNKIKNTVRITFLNSWEHVTGDIDITVGGP